MADEYTPWQLARLADCLDPDAPDSPGAKWLERVASDADEIDNEDRISELADAAVPIYTHERWQVFVDLGAYNEDPSELGADVGDMTQCAAVCLYMIAERLLQALWSERDEDADDEDEDEDEEPTCRLHGLTDCSAPECIGVLKVRQAETWGGTE